jgi:Mg2+/Co2+ transporter CorC
MNSVVEDILMHYGIPRRSGRYPWGSGDEPYQRNRDFLSRVEELKKQGWKETAENIEDEGYDTVGGLIINRLARIPEQDEDASVEYMGVRFTVLEVADRRIIKVRAEKTEEQTEE